MHAGAGVRARARGRHQQLEREGEREGERTGLLTGSRRGRQQARGGLDGDRDDDEQRRATTAVDGDDELSGRERAKRGEEGENIQGRARVWGVGALILPRIPVAARQRGGSTGTTRSAEQCEEDDRGGI